MLWSLYSSTLSAGVGSLGLKYGKLLKVRLYANKHKRNQVIIKENIIAIRSHSSYFFCYCTGAYEKCTMQCNNKHTCQCIHNFKDGLQAKFTNVYVKS